MWGGGVAAGQQNSPLFPPAFFGPPSGMMAGMPSIEASGLMFLPLLQQQALASGMAQQFGLRAFAQQAQIQSPLPSPVQPVKQEPLYSAPSAFQPATSPGAQQPAAQPALRPIRTRAAASATAQGGSGTSAGASGSMPPPPPVNLAGAFGNAAGGAGMDLAELLSPLAASLLSPLGLNGSPASEQLAVGCCSAVHATRADDYQSMQGRLTLHFSCPFPRLEGFSPEPPVHRPAGAPAVQQPGRWAGTCRPRSAQAAAGCLRDRRAGLPHACAPSPMAGALASNLWGCVVHPSHQCKLPPVPCRLRRQRPAERPAEPSNRRRRFWRKWLRSRPPPPRNRGHGGHSGQRCGRQRQQHRTRAEQRGAQPAVQQPSQRSGLVLSSAGELD